MEFIIISEEGIKKQLVRKCILDEKAVRSVYELDETEEIDLNFMIPALINDIGFFDFLHNFVKSQTVDEGEGIIYQEFQEIFSVEEYEKKKDLI